ncbi:MAG: small multi-drug export protein [Candidatus Shapirobacteria bacterium]|nr:small multi-drug export protein [Candidatus Shapirobacteria bacterium]
MNLLYIFLISMVPLIEQRGAIPVGILVYHINPLLVFIVSLVGSFLPAPFIFLFFNKILAWMKTVKMLHKFTDFVDKKVQKGAKKIEKTMEIGLTLFVGIPLPTTGLWTGTAIAAFLGLDFKKTMICVFLGGILSAVIITVLSLVAPAILGR